MCTFIHVVGPQGVGKSQVVAALAAAYQARGRVCAGHDPELFTSRAEAEQKAPGADVCFIEYHTAEALDARDGELVVQLSRAGA